MKTIFAILLMCFTGFAFADQTGNFGGVPSQENFEEKPESELGQDPGAMGEEEGDEGEEGYDGNSSRFHEGDQAPSHRGTAESSSDKMD